MHTWWALRLKKKHTKKTEPLTSVIRHTLRTLFFSLSLSTIPVRKLMVSYRIILYISRKLFCILSPRRYITQRVQTTVMGGICFPLCFQYASTSVPQMLVLFQTFKKFLFSSSDRVRSTHRKRGSQPKYWGGPGISGALGFQEGF